MIRHKLNINLTLEEDIYKTLLRKNPNFESIIQIKLQQQINKQADKIRTKQHRNGKRLLNKLFYKKRAKKLV